MRMQLCTYQHFVLLCITIFKTDLNTLLILNFSLCELAQLPLQSLLGAAVNIDLFIVCDCDWESFSPLCLITFYCHIKRKRNQNWLVVQLYCLMFHHGQTELSPLIHKNFFFFYLFFPFLLEPLFYWFLVYLWLTLFVILTSLILEILKNIFVWFCEHPLLSFVCFPLGHTAGLLMMAFSSFPSMSISRGPWQDFQRDCILFGIYCLLQDL